MIREIQAKTILRAILAQAHASGATCIIPTFGMTLRDRQRAYYAG